jgi:thymidylate kinase
VTIDPAVPLAETIDDLVHEDLLVVGSLPPAGRDLDLLARPTEYQRVTDWLVSAGFVNELYSWVRFAGCTVEALDLVPSAVFGRHGQAADELFTEARKLPGFRHLARPAPHHVLLMLSEDSETLSDKRRTSIKRALDEDPQAWHKAEERAAAWRAKHSLETLKLAYETGAPITRRRRAAALAEAVYGPGRTRSRARARAWSDVLRTPPQRGCVISLSGLDGAGKSSQSEALASTLRQLGLDVTIQWTRLEWTTLWENRWLGILGWPVRATLSLVARAQRRREPEGTDAPPSLEPSALRERSSVISQVWVGIVALAHTAAQRRETRAQLARGQVVICDRYTLDTAVHLRFRYGERRNFGWQIRLVESRSPRPVVAFLLDVPAATAYARKAEQYSLEDLERQASLYRQESLRLGVRRLDGELPREQLCTEIGLEVWRALRKSK